MRSGVRFSCTSATARAAVDNALRVLLAVGGSTNGAIHLTAIAGRVELLHVVLADRFQVHQDRGVGADSVEVLERQRDAGAAGGVGALLRELAPRLHGDAISVAGETLAERIAVQQR